MVASGMEQAAEQQQLHDNFISAIKNDPYHAGISDDDAEALYQQYLNTKSVQYSPDQWRAVVAQTVAAANQQGQTISESQIANLVPPKVVVGDAGSGDNGSYDAGIATVSSDVVQGADTPEGAAKLDGVILEELSHAAARQLGVQIQNNDGTAAETGGIIAREILFDQSYGAAVGNYTFTFGNKTYSTDANSLINEISTNFTDQRLSQDSNINGVDHETGNFSNQLPDRVSPDVQRAKEIISYLAAHKDYLLSAAKAAGVPATAVATAIGEEYRVRDFTSSIGHADTDSRIAPAISQDYSNQDILNFYGNDKSLIENGTLQPRGLPAQIGQHFSGGSDPLTFDIGPGRINFGAAVDLFENAPSDLIDSLGLGAYNGHLQNIAGDLANLNSNATIAFATLKIRQVQDWYVNNDDDRISAIYDAASPSQRDQLLDFGYRLSPSKVTEYFVNNNYPTTPKVRPNAYNFFNDGVSPYSYIRKTF